MSLALHYQPDPLRHIVRLPSNKMIDGHVRLKVYATNYACVYLGYGIDSPFYVYKIVVQNSNQEVLGALILSTSDLQAAMDAAGQEGP
jgi:hypothetical protein